MKPIMHRVQNPPGARGGGRHALCVLDPGDHRFFAEHMKARTKRPFDQRRMAARRRADVDEIEPFTDKQIVDSFRPSAIGTGGEKGFPARSGGVGRGDDPHVVTSAPAGQMPLGRDIAEADERASEHETVQSSPNRRAIAAKD